MLALSCDTSELSGSLKYSTFGCHVVCVYPGSAINNNIALNDKECPDSPLNACKTYHRYYF